MAQWSDHSDVDMQTTKGRIDMCIQCFISNNLHVNGLKQFIFNHKVLNHSKITAMVGISMIKDTSLTNK